VFCIKKYFIYIFLFLRDGANVLIKRLNSETKPFEFRISYNSILQLKNMKQKLTLFVLFSLLTIAAFSQSVGIGTSSPDTSALLHLHSSTKGLLPPKVELVATNNTMPVGNPAAGLLVYNTASAGGSPTNVKPGYYFWDGIKWVPVVNRGNSYGDMQYWDGNQWIIIPLGLNGQVLTICNGVPHWGNGRCQTELTLQPANNLYELNYNSYSPGNLASGGGAQFAVQAWTAFGDPLTSRQILKFDFSSIPPGAVIDSAKLYLYAANNPVGGNTVDAHSGSNNACYIQRITSVWDLPCPFSWINQPSVTAINQAIIPQSTFSAQDNIVMITDLVKDILTNGNYGFQIRLQSETIYNIRQYTASYNVNAAKHPRMVIYYH
jgi:hypothetical protein